MIERQFDVTALGELLIDFTENGVSAQGNPVLEANPGGAPCNVLSMLSRFGRKTAFIGKVGNDGFGNMLKQAIRSQGIDDRGLVMDEEVHTTLALVLKKENGDRDFAFYRKPGADVNLNETEVNEELIAQSKIFHFGSLSLTDEPARSATVKAIALAKKYECLISFDPNLREPLWNTLYDAKQQIAWGMAQADFMKISDNEITWFTGIENYDDAIAQLFADYPNLKLICLSLGSEGSCAYYDGIKVTQKPFLQEGTIETTGAGDTFCACVLEGILKYGIENLDEDKIRETLRFANGAASLITTKKGALKVMPEVAEVTAFLAERGE